MAADVPEPKSFSDAYFYAISANGEWGVSPLSSSISVYNFVTGQVDEWTDDEAYPTTGVGKCISNSGILVGSTDGIYPEYFKDGSWYGLEEPGEGGCANAITPDGSRICGSITVSGVSLDGDALMQAPVVWNATADGYGTPVRLPYPEFDITGRIPQYVTAADISDDGKKVIGQVLDAVGGFKYPIVYTEDADGNWSYELVHPELYTFEGLEFPEHPGECPANPDAKSYLTEEGLAEYNEAYQAFIDSGYDWSLYPDAVDFLTEEGLAEYNAAKEKFNAEYDVWSEADYAWWDVYDQFTSAAPDIVFNSVRISPDGNSWAYTVKYADPMDLWEPSTYNVWVFDMNSDKITKYDQTTDLNLMYLGNDAALASTSLGNVSDSYVLKDGECENIYDWMNKKSPVYASWMSDNMRHDYTWYVENEETWEYEEVEYEDVLMTGRAVATPDLSVVALSVQNVWDYMTEFDAYLFDINAGTSGVGSVRPESDGEKVIFDLSGRKLNSATAPGIYIINGKKQVVR